MRTCTIVSLCIATTLLAAELQAYGAPPRSPRSTEPSAEVQFADALRIINLADTAVRNGNYEQACDLYRDAYHAHALLAEQFPQWNPDVVRTRTGHCVDRMNALRDVMDTAPAIPDNATPHAEPNALARPPASGRIGSPPAESPQIKPLQPTVPPGNPIEDGPSHKATRPDGQESTSRLEQEPAPSLSAIKATAKRRIGAGEIDEARTLLLGALRENPDDTTIRLLLGLVQCRSGRFEDAVSLLRPLLEETPEDALAHLYLAGALTGLGQLNDAAKELRLAIRHEPGMHQAHFNLAQILLKLDPPDGATAREHYALSIKHGGPSDPALERRLPSASAP